MHRAILTLSGLLCLAPVPVQADCPDFERALFTPAISDREPHERLETLPENAQRVYFFMEIHDGADTMVTVTWKSPTGDASTVELPVGGDRWRTWSSRNVGAFAPGDWSVEVRPGDCEPRLFELPATSLDEHPRIAAIHSALEQGDLPAARLALDQARRHAPQAHETGLRRIAEIDIPLAELARDIDRGHLYIARSRQQRLEARIDPEDPDHQTLEKLTGSLARGIQERDREVRYILGLVEQVLASTPAGLLPCPASLEEADARRETFNPGLSLVATGFRPGTPAELSLLDSRTGREYSLKLSCQDPFPFLPPADLPVKGD